MKQLLVRRATSWRRLLSIGLTLGIIAGILPTLAADAATCPCTIWPTTATPATVTVNDTSSVELGVKFSSDTNGSITGVRFYKGPQNTGTHTGSLWNTSGTRLATATFTGETSSGWQQVNFASPVGITANTTYIASYLAPVGLYSADSNGLSNAVDNAPLHALASSASGGNGVYTYGGGFPTSSFNATNYWVDPVFSSTIVADITPPTVTAVSPVNGSSNASTGANITATFSETLDSSTVSSSSFELRNSANVLVAASVSYNPSGNVVTLDPTSNLTPGSYTASLKGGTTDPRIKDTAGNALTATYTWSFTAVAPAVLDQGPGGPILVIKTDTQPFSKYYAEILRAEGLNSFSTANVSAMNATLLNQYDVVVLGDVTLTATQVTTLTNWVTAGGNLVAMHPDKKLAPLLGLNTTTTTLSDAYMLVTTSAAPGQGITNQSMQYHGIADRYTLKTGTTAVAGLYSNASTATANPAVTMRSVGSAGGQAAAFTYDLAKSVIYTHQGNPNWAGQDRDGNGVIRPNDLFYGNSAGDVQPDYVDLAKVAIPQADEQMRLFSNTINFMNTDRKPLAKFWYLPKGAKAAVVMAGDDHATASGTKDSFNRLIANSPANCVVANWECARATSWIYANTPLTNQEASAYYAQGFDIGSHISSGCGNWTPASLETNFTDDLSAFQSKYTTLPAQTGNRIHCIAWSDWATMPKTELSHGIRVDLNYYYWPGSWVQDRPGFMTGSGLPMRYGDSDGSMIDVYQVPSNLVNESGQTFPANINTELDRALGPEGYYGAFGVHYDYSDAFDQQLMASAQARGIPLVSAKQILDWTDGRNASSITNSAWTGNNLGFTVTVDSRTGSMLRTMLPLSSSKGTLTAITKGGTAVSYTTENIKGVAYAMFAVNTGNYVAAYAADTTAPIVSSTVPAASATNVNANANLSATFSEAMNAATISNTTFTLATSGGTAIPGSVTYNAQTKVATFDPTSTLASGASYTATVKGTTSGVKDIAGNALTANKVWSFTVASSACPCSLWNSATTPTNVATTDSTAVEVGVKFTSDQAGNITGIRFYKGTTNTGTHTISLWNATSGVQLATATVSGETATGWQTGTFTTPVTIAANTTYIASYYVPSGHYAYDSNYFATARDAAPLHALANASSANGVYKYGGGLPDQSFGATNYWVDPVFVP